jgi:FtsP/CotA-like multicopper oxidase with cupredoxin domain
MEPLPGRIKLVIFFILGSMLVMFADGLFFDNYNSRPSMAMMHMEMRPTMYNDPAPPTMDEYFASWQDYPDLEADVDTPMQPSEILTENGVQIKVFRLVTNNVLHEIRPGVKVPMISFNNVVPAPTIRVTEGDRVRVILYNNATDPHTIHWHGVNNLSFEDDGVPDLGQHWVAPGESYTYDFIADPAGTKMYHCHVEAPHHMTMGMFGALIIDSKDKSGKPNPHDGSPYGPATVDTTFMLSEYDAKHNHIPLPGDMMAMGPDSNLPWLLPSPKFMMPFDPSLNEFMINGKSFPASKPVAVKEGDVVRLRLINIGLNVHSLHIHGHTFTVTHRDGYKLPDPFKVDTLLIGPGERYDVWFKADNPGLWMIHDHAGMNAMAKGYDPAGVMSVITYEGVSSEAYEALMERIRTYNEHIEHMDEHGMLTPTADSTMTMEGMGMGMDSGSGMDMGEH